MPFRRMPGDERGQHGAVGTADVRDLSLGQLVLVDERAQQKRAAADHGQVLQVAEPRRLIYPLEERLAEVVRRSCLARRTVCRNSLNGR